MAMFPSESNPTTQTFINYRSETGEMSEISREISKPIQSENHFMATIQSNRSVLFLLFSFFLSFFRLL